MNRTEPLAVVDRALAAITRYERPDLDDRLRHARSRLLDDRVRVLVVGEFKQGKSMLVNGLVGAPVCPTFDDIATAVPTHVRHAEKVTITLVRDLDPAGPDPDAAAHRADRGAGRRAGRARLRAGQPGQPGGLEPRRGRGSAAGAVRRAGAGGHPGRRRAAVGARRGDHGRAARRRRGVAGLGRLAGVHRARDGLPGARGVGLPERGLRAHQDRPVPGVAAHRRARTGATWPRPGSRAELFAVSSTPALARGAGERRGGQRRVRLPGADRVPAQAGARPGRPAGPPRGGPRRAGGHRAAGREPARGAVRPAEPGGGAAAGRARWPRPRSGPPR